MAWSGTGTTRPRRTSRRTSKPSVPSGEGSLRAVLVRRRTVPQDHTHTHPQLSRTVSLEDWRALNDLVHESSYRVDFAPLGVADLFVEDGWYGWNDKRSAGRETIRESYRLRAARGIRTARHLVTNLRVSMVADDIAEGQ